MSILVGCSAVAADVVTYELAVTNTWSTETHPNAFPYLAHFSWLGGVTHDDTVSFWDVGQLASLGMAQMAETGLTDILMQEVETKVQDGHAFGQLNWSHWFCPDETNWPSCGETTVTFQADPRFPLATLVTMLGPSPDWFVGVSGLPLREDGRWLPQVTVDLTPYDGGTRSDNVFALYGTLNSPPEPISRITDASGQLVGPESLGAMTFTLLTPELLAGDADRDLDFDQFDLIQVQRAGKYFTGLPATWGQGDWDGAPGGTVDNPPPGDDLFDQRDIIAALKASTYLHGPYAAELAMMPRGDNQTSIGYDSTTGQVWVDVADSAELTSVNIESSAGVFTSDVPLHLTGSFDIATANNLFKATFGSSFGSLSFGTIAQRGLSKQFLLNDLSVDGSMAGGGSLGKVQLIYVPEPAGGTLLLVGLLLISRAVLKTMTHAREANTINSV